MPDAAKVYDKEYFDRWYRDPRSRVRTEEALRRKVRMAVAVAEFFLARPVETVLDVGCGEGAWLAPLRGIRPQVSYLGVDSSDYAVEKFGADRNIVRADFGDIGRTVPRRKFDLLVCSDMLHYVGDDELARGMPQIAKRLGGVAFLELLTTDDFVEGDLKGWQARPASFYRDLFRRHGLEAIGLQCYVGDAMKARVAALERLAT